MTLVACAHGAPRIGVRAGEVLKHTTELGRDGSAQLETRPGEHVNVSVDALVTFRGSTIILVKLLEGCAPFTGASPCALVAREGELVYLRPAMTEPKPDREPAPAEHMSTRHQVRIVTGTLSLASLGGAALCLAYCESDKGLKSAALAGSGLLFALIFALAGGDVRD